jgi:hypothetical protein
VVVEAGGPGQGAGNGGGGAGGFRESSGTASGCYTASPLAGVQQLYQFQQQGYPITVGAGGAGSSTRWSCNNTHTRSCWFKFNFSTITSAGGGGGSAKEEVVHHYMDNLVDQVVVVAGMELVHVEVQEIHLQQVLLKEIMVEQVVVLIRCRWRWCNSSWSGGPPSTGGPGGTGATTSISGHQQLSSWWWWRWN